MTDAAQPAALLETLIIALDDFSTSDPTRLELLLAALAPDRFESA